MAKKKKKAEIQAIYDIDGIRDAFSQRFGEGAIIPLSGYRADCEIIPSGSLALDIALGVGGYPRGRTIEIIGPESSGKTTLALHAVANVQKAGGVAAFIDAEHALDPVYMKRLGIDLERVLVSQPDNGEQALEMAELLVESQGVDVVVVDSVAALVPKAELEGDIGDSNIGAQARLMSGFMRRITAKVKKSNCVVIFINQIRMKIGVMFGCLHGDTQINFVNGASMPIRDVVDNKIEGEVWSYDETNNKFTPARIVDWHNNGDVADKSDFLSIYMQCPGNKNGSANITVTPNHKVMTDSGWMDAEQLYIGSKILTKQESIMSGTVGDFLRGVLSGDSHITTRGNRFGGSLKLRDNTDTLYTEWKANKLRALMDFTEHKCNSGVYFNSRPFSELVNIKNTFPNRDPMLLLQDFSWLGFAIWLMDDAVYQRQRYQLSIKRFKGCYDKIQDISRELDTLGLYHHASIGGRITFDKDVSDMIAEHICKYVPPCMDRKLPDKLRGKYEEFTLERTHMHTEAYADVIDIREASSRQMRHRGKYDLSIEGCHNYLAGGSHNGVIVHNSPETAPGGRALKFYSSVRLDIRKQNVISDGSNDDKSIIGHVAKIKVIKNKVATPFKQCIVNIIYGRGIDYELDILDIATKIKLINKSGSWYSYDDVRIGNGAVQAAQFLKENESMRDKINKQIRDQLLSDEDVTTDDGPEDEEQTENTDVESDL